MQRTIACFARSRSWWIASSVAGITLALFFNFSTDFSVSQNLTVQAAESCQDSDGGLNYSVRGGANRGNTPPSIDSCYCPIGENRTNLGACTAGPFVGEWFCNVNGYVEMKTYECPNGCRSGACIETSSAPCTNSSCVQSSASSNSSAAIGISCGNGTVDRGEECDEGGNNGAVDSSCNKECRSYICQDTDGDNIYIQGKFTSKGETTEFGSYPESCILDTGAGRPQDVESCTGDTCHVREYVCYGSQGGPEIRKCANGCKHGSCNVDLPSITDARTSDNFKNTTFTLSELPPIPVQLWAMVFKGETSGPDDTSIGGGGMAPQQKKSIIFGGLQEDFERAGGDGVYTIKAYVCPGPNTPGGFDFPENPSCGPTFTKTIHYTSSFSVPDSIPSAGYEEEVRVIDRTSSSKNWFRDVIDGASSAEAANFLAQNAIIGGFPDHTFRPYALVNRAEAAKFLMLARFKGLSDRMNKGRFWDVREGEWYVRFVMKAAELGVINGHPDGSFKPQDPVRTSEFLKMLALTFDLPTNLPHKYSDVHADDWFAPYVGIAAKYDFLGARSACDPSGCDHSVLLPDTPLTRGDVANAIYAILKEVK